MITNRNITMVSALRPFVNGEGATTFLQNQLGISKYLNDQKSLAIALQNPAKYIREKNEEIEIMTVKLGEKYVELYDKYINLGVPASDANDLALSHVNDLMKNEMEFIQLKFPGQEIATNELGIRRNTIDATSIRGLNEITPQQRYEIYKDERKKKKEKRAKILAKYQK